MSCIENKPKYIIALCISRLVGLSEKRFRPCNCNWAAIQGHVMIVARGWTSLNSKSWNLESETIDIRKESKPHTFIVFSKVSLLGSVL